MKMMKTGSALMRGVLFVSLMLLVGVTSKPCVSQNEVVIPKRSFI